MKESDIQAASKKTASFFAVAPQVWGTRDIFVNFYYIQNTEDNSWVLVDAGLKTSYDKIKKAVAALFGPDSKPSAIILTHGHFDHVGALKKLVEEWNVPVYAHYMELPYLTGRSSYPPPDPAVGGGAMSFLSFLYPKKPIDLGGSVNALPEDHSVPGLPGWRWIHTPGHTPGHISLYREEGKILIAGDAFVTTHAESVWSIVRQAQVVSGPPKYYTPDWITAARTVKNLASINPNVAATGHGMPMYGNELKTELQDLADHFREKAVPKQGRYVAEGSVADASGVLYIPKAIANRKKQVAIIGGVAVLVGLLTFWVSRRNRN